MNIQAAIPVTIDLAAIKARPVSYTHLTLPTICTVVPTMA